jgi:hypothetical protein
MINKVLAVAAASSMAAMAFYAEGCGSSQEATTDAGSDSETIVHHPGGGDSGAGGEGGSSGGGGSGADANEMCDPGSVTGVKFGLNPSAASAGMCTPALIETIVDDCFGGDPDAGTDTCNQILQPHTAVFACYYNCVEVDWTGSAAQNYMSTPWGGFPNLIYPSGGSFGFFNSGGCILAAGGGNAAVTTCAEDFEEDLECDLQACGANCPLPAQNDPTFNEAATALINCIGAADPPPDAGVGECSKYSAAINADCSADSGPVAAAVNLCGGLFNGINDQTSSLADFVQAWNQYLNLVCVPAARDAGTADAGGITDGGDGG